MELLNAAYALHPGFAEARILETGAGIRPAFIDNTPRVVKTRDGLAIAGLYRHGFLWPPRRWRGKRQISYSGADERGLHERDRQW